MKDKIIIGTRSSKLALWQADHIAECLRKEYPALQVEKKLVTTKGDRILDVPLAKIGGKGLFTKELEEEMLSGRIDIAVHSLKDMPASMPCGLTLAAVTEREDASDAFVSKDYDSLAALPEGACLGTSSLRRRAQLLHVRPDLHIKTLRGNVETRLRKMQAGEFSAIVLACAGLKRLGLAQHITEVLPVSICLPAVGQGALAIETRADDAEMISLLEFLNDKPTGLAAQAERAFLARVEGGCQVPVGVYARAEHGLLSVEAVIASLDGRTLLRAQTKGTFTQAAALGEGLADELLERGGLAIMQSLGLLLDR